MGRDALCTPWAVRSLRKLAVAVLGFSVLACGIACVVLPAPAVLVIPLGLAILATEFRWARNLLEPLRTLFRRFNRQPS